MKITREDQSKLNKEQYAKHRVSRLHKAKTNYARKRHLMPAEQRRRNLKHKYNLTPEQYNEILLRQNGVCAICSLPDGILNAKTGKPGHLPVDHNHKTGQVRGLLCFTCNSAIGLLKCDDSNELLVNALKYLGYSFENN